MKIHIIFYVFSSVLQVNICENFLRVADLVLSWNFEIHRFPVRITFANEGAPAAALRPPESWKAIFQSDEFLRLFFGVASIKV